jgi:hypothetical protein
MAINFETSNPAALHAAIKKAIDDKHIVTWTYDKDGDFTHLPDQWAYQAWLRPRLIYPGLLTMNFLGRQDRITTKPVYGVYHGRFIESVLTHFDLLFTGCIATALPADGDWITTNHGVIAA